MAMNQATVNPPVLMPDLMAIIPSHTVTLIDATCIDQLFIFNRYFFQSCLVLCSWAKLVQILMT